jgi:hypothetical protein
LLGADRQQLTSAQKLSGLTLLYVRRGEDMASAGATTYWVLGFLLTDGLQQRFESRRIGLVSRYLLGRGDAGITMVFALCI